jgi:hypothetical protein
MTRDFLIRASQYGAQRSLARFQAGGTRLTDQAPTHRVLDLPSAPPTASVFGAHLPLLVAGAEIVPDK